MVQECQALPGWRHMGCGRTEDDMKKILIINGHQPYPFSEGRLNAALMARAEKRLSVLLEPYLRSHAHSFEPRDHISLFYRYVYFAYRFSNSHHNTVKVQRSQSFFVVLSLLCYYIVVGPGWRNWQTR